MATAVRLTRDCCFSPRPSSSKSPKFAKAGEVVLFDDNERALRAVEAGEAVLHREHEAAVEVDGDDQAGKRRRR